MQQIATSQKDIAAGTLPIEIAVETPQEGQAFQSVMQTAASPKPNSPSQPASPPNGKIVDKKPYEPDPKAPSLSVDNASSSNQKPSADEDLAIRETVSGDAKSSANFNLSSEQVQAEIDEMLGNQDTPDIDWVSFVESIDKQLAGGSKVAVENKEEVSLNDIAVELVGETKVEGQEAQLLVSDKTEQELSIPIDKEVQEAIAQPAEAINTESKVALIAWSEKVATLIADSEAAASPEKIEADATLLQDLIIGTVIQPSGEEPDNAEGRDTQIDAEGLDTHSDTDVLISEAGIALEASDVEGEEPVSPFPIVVDSSKVAPIPSSVKEEKAISMTVSEEAIKPIAEHIAAVLEEPVVEKAAAKAISGEIAAMAKEFAAQKSEGREPGISLKKAVAAAIDKGELSLTAEQQQAVAQQVSRAEQMVNIIKSVAEAAPQPLQSVTVPFNANTADHQLLAAAERVTAEGSVQVSDQLKTNQATLSQIDKPVPVHQPEGQKQVAEKIRWMVNSRTTAAEIRLDPPELGSMQIRVNMSGDTASVSFIVQSAQARDVLADATPRLRDMLAEQGIDLGESFVAQQDQQQSFDEGNGSGSGSASGFAGEEEEMNVVEQPINRPSVYNIDAYV